MPSEPKATSRAAGARYTLRAADKDGHFGHLYRLHRAVMEEVVTRVFGEWDDAWQEARFSERWPVYRQRVVVDGRDAGFLDLWEAGDALVLDVLALGRRYHGSGLGTAILRDLQTLAAARGLPLVLQVLRGNRARALYERLGFTVTGETETHVRMAWRARGDDDRGPIGSTG